MIFIFDGIVLGIVLLIAIVAICGGATAIANFIISHMAAILIVSSVIFLIGLILFWISITEVIEKKIYKILSMIIAFAESIFSVIALRTWLLHFVESQETMGFFGFALEIILSSVFGLLPIFGSKIASLITVIASEDLKKDGSKFAIITFIQALCTLLIILNMTLIA